MPLSKHFRFCLWWESFFNGGHFSTCQTRKKSTPVPFFLHMRHVFLRPGVISLRRKMTPRSIFDGGRYSSLHRRLSVRPSVRLSGSHTFVVVTHSYVSQATHAFLGMLLLCCFFSICVQYKKSLLLRCIHHFKSDLINNMDHMRISGTEPSSVILS